MAHPSSSLSFEKGKKYVGSRRLGSCRKAIGSSAATSSGSRSARGGEVPVAVPLTPLPLGCPGGIPVPLRLAAVLLGLLQRLVQPHAEHRPADGRGRQQHPDRG